MGLDLEGLHHHAGVVLPPQPSPGPREARALLEVPELRHGRLAIRDKGDGRVGGGEEGADRLGQTLSSRRRGAKVSNHEARNARPRGSHMATAKLDGSEGR